MEPGGPPPPVYDPDPRLTAPVPFAMSTAEWQAMVNTQPTSSAGTSGRDPAKEVDRLAVAEERYAALPGRWEWLARLCDEAYGLPRHLSQHSGGMIVSTRPLIDCCPVLPAAMEGRQLCQWDKDSCADAGFAALSASPALPPGGRGCPGRGLRRYRRGADMGPSPARLGEAHRHTHGV